MSEQEEFGHNSIRVVPSSGIPEVVIRNRRAQPFFGRHPWVFAGAVDQVRSGSDATSIEPGTTVRVVSSEGKFIAWGLINPNSRIVVRLYSWNSEETLSPEFWRKRIHTAVQARKAIFDLKADSTGCRLVFSESDVLSGLTVDFYGRYLLVQFTSLALYKYRDALIDALNQEVQPKGIWLRTEKGMREAEGLEAVDGLLSGEEPPRPLFIDEHGVTYGVDVQQGQKTGCYLDQRDNRLAVSRYVRGAKVLDAFCFSGGFGITAAKVGKAASVLGIDSSESALTLARANAELNSVAEKCQWRRDDVRPALEQLAAEGKRFDVVILDPPRMARTRGGLDRAINGYARLNMAGLQVLEPGGILVTCSCSGLVSRQEFFDMLAEVARQSGRNIQVLESLGQPADHPVSVTCPESEYLKVFICRVS
ncbi:MAG: class I SAM-dependent rRNA methyltransferase [Planctomycetaceae bacterium]|nr:class I SAM-dependent rRNA methyltransferase [Planctomycetaceae bacterium]